MSLFEQYMPDAENSSCKWYLVRTKQYKEVFVQSTLSRTIPDNFLPLLRTRRARSGIETETVAPLFPGYLFANLDLRIHYYAIQRTPGVAGLVCAGDQPCEVEEKVIAEIKHREINGAVDLNTRPMRSGEQVRVIEGPLRGVSAIFDRFLTGSDRVALLIELVGRSNVRAILPSALIELTSKPNFEST